MSDLIKCAKCGKETNKYSPSCEYCSAPLERGDNAAQTIEGHGKALSAELGKYSNRPPVKKPADDVRKYKILFLTFLAGIGALFILVLIFMGTANFLKGPAAIKYDNNLSPAVKSDPVKADYVKKYITITDVGTLEETDSGSPGVTKYFYGTIKNAGDRTIIKLTLAVYYFDKKGRCIAEGTISPMPGTRDNRNSIGPASSKVFILPVMNANPAWSGRIKEKVSDIEFL